METVSEAGETGFNDVLADPAGRVFCGTLQTCTVTGKLLRLDPDRSIKVVAEGIGVSNGLRLTPDFKHLYLTDSKAGRIYYFDYDLDTGDIYNQRVFTEVPPEQGVPDGLTVDDEGHIWSARWDGWDLYQYKSDGTEELQIRFPARKIASVTFGSDDGTDIYVTTGGGNSIEENGPAAGALFRVNLGIQGRAEFLSRIEF